LGERLLMVSSAGVMLKGTASEIRPPLRAVMDAEPGCAIRFAGITTDS